MYKNLKIKIAFIIVISLNLCEDIQTLNSIAIRQYLGGTFIENIPQDASEFLLTLIKNDDDVKVTLEHELNHTMCWNICNQTSTSREKNLISIVTMYALEGRSEDLQEIIKTYSQWQKLDLSCNICGSNDRFFKTDITMVGNNLLMQLMPFKSSGKGIMQMTKYSIKGVSTTKIHIAQKTYKTICAIFYQNKINKINKNKKGTSISGDILC